MKTNLPEEVLVLRFFESGPIDKVEAVFNIVCDKMRERGRTASAAADPPSAMTRNRRRQPPKPELSTSTEHSEPKSE